MQRRYAVCVNNDGYEASLERNKIYAVVVDIGAERAGELRIIDESGEDYLYAADRFVGIQVPPAVEASLRRVSMRKKVSGATPSNPISLRAR